MNENKMTFQSVMKYLFSAPATDSEQSPNSPHSEKMHPVKHGTDKIDYSVMPVRNWPEGTRLISKDDEQAVMTVQAAIQFWCWAGPGLCLIAILFAVPIGSSLGYATAIDSARFVSGKTIISHIFWGGGLGLGACLLAAAISYAVTRPVVRIIVDKNYVQFGSYKFDRRFAGGLRTGYASEETELTTNITQSKFGVTNLWFAYGPWGEEMKYLVNAKHADAICNWMNGIINAVGAPEPKENDAAKGRKVEML